MTRRGWGAIGALAGVALGSLGLNAVLLRTLVRQYREEQRVRLDPTASAQARDRAGRVDATDTRTIVLFGDSRIRQWGSFPRPRGCRVVNQGVGDETTAQGLLRLRRDVLDLEPDLVVIQFGVNDLKSVGVLPDEAGRIERQCVANLRRMVEAIRGGGGEVVLLTVFPVGEASIAHRLVWSDRTIEAIDRVNRELRDPGGPGVEVLDCDPVLREGRRIRPGFAADHLHLNPAGYSKPSVAVEPLLGPIDRGGG